MHLRLPAVRRRAGNRQDGADSRETPADEYLADAYAGEHFVGRYAASGDTLVDRLRPANEDADGLAAEHEPVLDAKDLKRQGRRRRARTTVGGLTALSGRAFAAATVVPALLAMAWLLPGTGMLLAGRLRAVPMVIIFVPLAAALLAMLVIAAGFGVWQAVFRSEQVFVTSDPGVYLQYGYWIAGHGTARIPVSAAAFGTGFGEVAGLDFASPGFTASGSSITPAFLPGLPLVLAGGTWLGGLGGALLMPAVPGGCAVLSFAGLAGRRSANSTYAGSACPGCGEAL